MAASTGQLHTPWSHSLETTTYSNRAARDKIWPKLKRDPEADKKLEKLVEELNQMSESPDLKPHDERDIDSSPKVSCCVFCGRLSEIDPDWAMILTTYSHGLRATETCQITSAKFPPISTIAPAGAIERCGLKFAADFTSPNNLPAAFE